MLVSIAALSAPGWAHAADAYTCLGDRIGEPVNCTANDIRITDFHDVVVTDDGCTSQTDTVTFDAILTVVTTATSRYDIGLFIGVDGKQAQNGQCVVRSLPTGPAPFRQLDDDACGDTSSAGTVNVAVKNVTVNCVDANNDRELDVASCTSWQQNGNQECTGAVDVEPGTASKCNCSEAPIDIPIFVPEPPCTSNSGCTPDPTDCKVGVCAPDDPAANGSGCVFVPSDARCSDGLFCNGAETCSATLGCQAGTAPNCLDAVACTADACNESNDTCTHTTSNALCSNNLFCDGIETCSATLGCQAAAAPNCGDAFACTADACNEATDTCTHVTSDALCSNSQFCDGTEICNATLGCRPGIAPNCSDSIACTTDVCNEATDSCMHATSNAACSNNLFCDGAETCSPIFGCQTGSVPNCADTISCTNDACNESTDSCTHAVSDALCSDGLFCDGIEVCNPVLGCEAGPPPNCGDMAGCTVDACNETSNSCTHTTDDSLCSDNVFCNGAERCHPIIDCMAGAPPNCIDTAGCTVDSCNEAFDRCDNIPNHVVCADSDVCTDDICSPVSDCLHTNNTAPCDDQNQCTGLGHCQADQCLAGEPVCGNGIIDAACGEICDSGSGEICNNGIDDNGNGLIDCADDDCSDLTVQACDAECQPTPNCVPILEDPAIITMAGASDPAIGGGSFTFHGRMIPETDLDPQVDGFVLVISNDAGQVFRAEVDSRDLETLGSDRYFLNATSSASSIANGGIYFLRIRRRMDEGAVAYTVKLRAYGDFTRATTSLMTTQMYFGDDVGFVTANWNRRPGRWTLYPNDY